MSINNLSVNIICILIVYGGQSGTVSNIGKEKVEVFKNHPKWVELSAATLHSRPVASKFGLVRPGSGSGLWLIN